MTWVKELLEKIGFAGENEQRAEEHVEAEEEQESTVGTTSQEDNQPQAKQKTTHNKPPLNSRLASGAES